MQDESTFLLELPEGTDPPNPTSDRNIGIATALLEEDNTLAAKRYKYVPRSISDEEFWRRYLHRVFEVQHAMKTAHNDSDHPGWRRRPSLDAPATPSSNSPVTRRPVVAASPPGTAEPSSRPAAATSEIDNRSSDAAISSARTPATLSTHAVDTMTDDDFDSAVQALHIDDAWQASETGDGAHTGVPADQDASLIDEEDDEAFERAIAAELAGKEAEPSVPEHAQLETEDTDNDLAALEAELARELSDV